MTTTADSPQDGGMNDYEALKAYGHSPAKAAEIVLDARRGDFFSQGWIKVVRAATPESTSCRKD